MNAVALSASPGAKPGSCLARQSAVKPGANHNSHQAHRRASAVWPRLEVLAIASVVLAGCGQVGAVKLQGAYSAGAGDTQREISGAVTFKLRDRARRDGKTWLRPVALNSPAEPDCAGGGR